MTKYKAVRTVVDGIAFASKKEARRYLELRLLERAGEIHSLQLQPSFPIVVNGVKVCKYVADFSYIDHTGSPVVEDVKGMKTPIYNLKKRLVKAVHGVEIHET